MVKQQADQLNFQASQLARLENLLETGRPSARAPVRSSQGDANDPLTTYKAEVSDEWLEYDVSMTSDPGVAMAVMPMMGMLDAGNLCLQRK